MVLLLGKAVVGLQRAGVGPEELFRRCLSQAKRKSKSPASGHASLNDAESAIAQCLGDACLQTDQADPLDNLLMGACLDCTGTGRITAASLRLFLELGFPDLSSGGAGVESMGSLWLRLRRAFEASPKVDVCTLHEALFHKYDRSQRGSITIAHLRRALKHVFKASDTPPLSAWEESFIAQALGDEDEHVIGTTTERKVDYTRLCSWIFPVPSLDRVLKRVTKLVGAKLPRSHSVLTMDEATVRTQLGLPDARDPKDRLSPSDIAEHFQLGANEARALCVAISPHLPGLTVSARQLVMGLRNWASQRKDQSSAIAAPSSPLDGAADGDVRKASKRLEGLHAPQSEPSASQPPKRKHKSKKKKTKSTMQQEKQDTHDAAQGRGDEVDPAMLRRAEFLGRAGNDFPPERARELGRPASSALSNLGPLIELRK